MNTSLRATLLVSLSALALAACNVEDESPTADDVAVDADEVLGVAEQEFGGTGLTGFLTRSNGASGNTSLGGSLAGAASFITAISGNLGDGAEIAIHAPGGVANIWGHAAAGSSIGYAGGRVTPGSGTAYSEKLYGNSGQNPPAAKVYLADADGSTICFITQVFNYTGDKFGASGDRLKIVTENNKYYLHGSGKVTGAARCTAITQFIAGSGGNGKADPYSLGANSPGKACFLQSVGGSFRAGTGDGVFINWNAGTGWSLTVSPGKWGTAACAY